jgi:hypothetical protein
MIDGKKSIKTENAITTTISLERITKFFLNNINIMHLCKVIFMGLLAGLSDLFFSTVL